MLRCYIYIFSIRRVHITEATLKHLNKAYEVEEGNGHLRDTYLKELNVKTYLVIDPRVENLNHTLAVYIYIYMSLYVNLIMLMFFLYLCV